MTVDQNEEPEVFLEVSDPAKFAEWTRVAQKRSRLSLISDIQKKLKEQQIEMKDTHFCRFNDGAQNCDCYLSALTDISKYLKEIN